MILAGNVSKHSWTCWINNSLLWLIHRQNSVKCERVLVLCLRTHLWFMFHLASHISYTCNMTATRDNLHEISPTHVEHPYCLVLKHMTHSFEHSGNRSACSRLDVDLIWTLIVKMTGLLTVCDTVPSVWRPYTVRNKTMEMYIWNMESVRWGRISINISMNISCYIAFKITFKF